MSHGWSTKKQADGTFTWAVYRTTWSEAAGRGITETLKSGNCPTRARAEGFAKRWVLFFRQGGQLAAA